MSWNWPIQPPCVHNWNPQLPSYISQYVIFSLDFAELEFPSSLTSTERAYIHRLVQSYGLKSKSRGYAYWFLVVTFRTIAYVEILRQYSFTTSLYMKALHPHLTVHQFRISITHPKFLGQPSKAENASIALRCWHHEELCSNTEATQLYN